MTRKKSETFNFESALDELTNLVEQMEKGGLSLEQSLTSFEKGVSLTRQCQKALGEAEQKVQILLEKNKQLELVDYEDDES